MGRIAYWRNHIVVTVLSWLGIAPKGTVDVHKMLFVTADYLAKGGDKGIFSPMHMILCRKPEEQQPSSDQEIDYEGYFQSTVVLFGDLCSFFRVYWI